MSLARLFLLLKHALYNVYKHSVHEDTTPTKIIDYL